MLKFTAPALAICVAMAAPALAQDYPNRPITVVVPYAAGGPVDTVARIAAARIGEILGQQMVIENVGGAGGMTGSARVSKAAPDGYTVLLSGSAVLAQVPQLYARPLYDPIADFDHAALFNDSARVLIVRKDFPANNYAEFAAYAKANAKSMQYGSAGMGSGSHTCGILIDMSLGVTVTHVPYRGAGPAMQDLIAGRLDFIPEQISTATPQIKGGTVKALVTYGTQRAPGLEEVPSAPELGLKGLDCGAWGGFSFPKGTPKAIIDRLAKATAEAIDTPGVIERYKGIGVVVPAKDRRSPDYFTKFVQSEIERWAVPIKASGMKID
jgi:tripartite-type tricarboxylate transporter receptor subunit TctC